MPEIDAVLLDSGGVLLAPDPAAFRRALAPFGVTPDDDTCLRGHYASMREIDRLGRVDWPQADRVLARELGITGDAVEGSIGAIEAVYLASEWVPLPGVVTALRDL